MKHETGIAAGSFSQHCWQYTVIGNPFMNYSVKEKKEETLDNLNNIL